MDSSRRSTDSIPKLGGENRAHTEPVKRVGQHRWLHGHHGMKFSNSPDHMSQHDGSEGSKQESRLMDAVIEGHSQDGSKGGNQKTREAVERIKRRETVLSGDFAQVPEAIRDYCEGSLEDITVDNLKTTLNEISDLIQGVSYARFRTIYEGMPDAKNVIIDSFLLTTDDPSSKTNSEQVKKRLRDIQATKEFIGREFGTASFGSIIDNLKEIKPGKDEEIENHDIEKSYSEKQLEQHLKDLQRIEKAIAKKEASEVKKEASEVKKEASEVKKEASGSRKEDGEDFDNYLKKRVLKRRETLISLETSIRSLQTNKSEEEQLTTAIKEELHDGIISLQENMKSKGKSKATEVKRSLTWNQLAEGMKEAASGIGEIAESGIDVAHLAVAIGSGDVKKITDAISSITSQDLENLGEGAQRFVQGLGQVLNGLKESERIKNLKESLMEKIRVFEKSRKLMQEETMKDSDDVEEKLRRAITNDKRLEDAIKPMEASGRERSRLERRIEFTKSQLKIERKKTKIVSALTDIFFHDMVKRGKFVLRGNEEEARFWRAIRDRIDSLVVYLDKHAADPEMVRGKTEIVLERIWEKRMQRRALKGNLALTVVTTSSRRTWDALKRHGETLDAKMVFAIAAGATKPLMRALQKAEGTKANRDADSEESLVPDPLSGVLDFEHQVDASDHVDQLLQAGGYTFKDKKIREIAERCMDIDRMEKEVTRAYEQFKTQLAKDIFAVTMVTKTALLKISEYSDEIDEMPRNTALDALEIVDRESKLQTAVNVLSEFNRELDEKSKTEQKAGEIGKFNEIRKKAQAAKDKHAAYIEEYYGKVLADSAKSNLEKGVESVLKVAQVAGAYAALFAVP